MAIFTGAGVAIVTPMHENGDVNYEKLSEILEEQIARRHRCQSLSAEPPENHPH